MSVPVRGVPGLRVATPGQYPMVDLMVGGIFLLVILSQGWLTAIRDWISAKVSE